MASHEEVPPDEGMSPPVIISFAAGDAETVREAAAALQSRGHGVTLVPGVDTDPDALTAAIARHSAQGLYVLCRSGALTRDTIDDLRALLRANGVPFGRTLTLALEARRARALEERIVSVLRRMITGRGALPRPVVPVPTPPAEPDEETDTMIRPPGESGRIAVASTLIPAPPLDQEDIAAWADSLVGQAVPRSEMGLSGPYPTVPQNASPEPTDPNASTSRIEPGQFEAITADLVARGNTAVSPLPKPPARPPEVPTIPDLPPRPVASAPHSVPRAPERPAMPSAPIAPVSTGPTFDSSPSARAPTSTDELDDEDFVVGGRFSQALGGPKGLALVVGGVLAVALIIAAAVAFSGDESSKKPEVAKADDKTVAAASEGKKDAEPRDAEPAPSPVPNPADDEDMAVDDGPGGAADDGPGGAPAEADQPETDAPPREAAVAKTEAVAPPKPEPAPKPAPAPKPEAKPEPEPEPEPVRPAKSAEPVSSADAAAIARALRDREVRALDVFIVSPESKKTTTHAGAVVYCETLVVAEIAGWRLPQIGELNSLGTAKLVRKDTFWSDTDGDTFGDTRLVLNAKRERIGAAPKTWDGAKAVCIRKRS
jgi:hypothetical protein